MIAPAAKTDALEIANGNVRIDDRTRNGVDLRVARGVERQEALNPWFARHVPKPPWRELDEIERRALLQPPGEPSPSTIRVLDLPPSILEAFWDRHLERILRADDDPDRRAAVAEFQRFVLDALSETRSEFGPVRVARTRTFDVVFGPPGAASTSFDPKSGKYVGLHIDDHENLPFDRRALGFRLMGMNLGRAERHFQFVNRDVASLLALVGGVRALPRESPTAAALAQTFLREFPDCPVLRITLRPGQAYVAVTQDLLHDGAANDLGRPDVNALLGGDVRIESRPS